MEYIHGFRRLGKIFYSHNIRGNTTLIYEQRRNSRRQRAKCVFISYIGAELDFDWNKFMSLWFMHISLNSLQLNIRKTAFREEICWWMEIHATVSFIGILFISKWVVVFLFVSSELSSVSFHAAQANTISSLPRPMQHEFVLGN